jgi:hypothetical protein
VDDPNLPYKGVRGKGKVKIHEDINHNMPIAEKIIVKYLGSLAHPMATSLIGSIKDGDSVILEITPSYYSTWDYSEKKRQKYYGNYAIEKDKDNRHTQIEFLIIETKEDMYMASIITAAKLQLKSSF